MRVRIGKIWERMQTMPMTRRARRLLVAIYGAAVVSNLCSAMVGLFPIRTTTRLYGAGAFVLMLTAMFTAAFWMWWLGRLNSVPSVDDQAQLDFGRPYAELSAMHQFDVKARLGRKVRREMLGKGSPADERDLLLRREGERIAFRILRAGLPVGLLLYWISCLSLPASEVRAGLLIGGLVMSAMVIAVLTLPSAVRLWMEPDQIREPAILTLRRET